MTPQPSRRRSTRPSPRPFLKWAGGKRALLPQILGALPEGKFEFYVEPFLGGGAVFLESVRTGRIGRAVLCDRNLELVETWRAVKTAPETVFELFGQWAQDKETYYAVRALEPAELSPHARAARVIYLNRNGFNGLYRLNRSGGFNVPYGAYARPQRLDLDNLLAVSHALESVELVCEDFESVLKAAPAGAVTYCDPPYWPASKTASFRDYDQRGFTGEDQKRLGACFRELGGRGIVGLLSNADVPETRALYAGLEIGTVQCRRSINRDGAKRGMVNELLVRTPTVDGLKSP